MGENYFRLGIAGLPAAGKTQLAYRLWHNVDDQGIRIDNSAAAIACLSGDMILPENIESVCNVVDRFIVEHICLPQLILRAKKPFCDMLVYLDISVEECKRRADLRVGHAVGVDSFVQLKNEIENCINKIGDSTNIAICTVGEEQQRYIREIDLMGYQLLKYLFSNKNIWESYLGYNSSRCNNHRFNMNALRIPAKN